jgi:hypothetical protein
METIPFFIWRTRCKPITDSRDDDHAAPPCAPREVRRAPGWQQADRDGREGAHGGTLPAGAPRVPPQLHRAPARHPGRPRPGGEEWLHEIKFDGYRTTARLEAGKVRMLARSGLDWTARFWPIATALGSVPVRTAYLDGEIAVLGEDGVTSFAALQDALSRGRAERQTYQVFDLLHLDGHNLTGLPLTERKAMLEALLAKLAAGSPIRYSSQRGEGAAVLPPGLRAQSRGNRVQARDLALPPGSVRRLAQSQMPQPAGVRRRRLDGIGQAGPVIGIAAPGLLPQGQAGICREGGRQDST